MQVPTTASLPRSVGVAVGVTAAAVAGSVLLLQQLTDPVTSVADALVELCLLALVGCVAWAWLAAMSVVVEAWAVGAQRWMPAVPHVARRLLLAACGVAVATALSPPASVADDEPSRIHLGGLPMPERALGGAHLRPTPTRTVVVRAGECLWSLAAEDLGPAAAPAAVTARWRQIYRRNRAVIGPDPGLIHPGQLLELPPSP